MAATRVDMKRYLLLAVILAALLALMVEFEHVYVDESRVREGIGMKFANMLASTPLWNGSHGVSLMQSKNNTVPLLWWTEHYHNMSVLSQRDIDGVEKFVFFIGYPRSGHSIIGSMMDAHPNMIITHEFMLFKKMTEDPFVARLLRNKTVLFNVLYQKSCRDADSGWRSSQWTAKKGYTLKVGTPWHGNFDKTLKVIGDKSGGQTVLAYGRDNDHFRATLHQLHHTVKIPIRVIHVVRNPYDMIATASLYSARDLTGTKRLHTLYAEGETNETSLKGESRYKEEIINYMHHHSKYFVKLASYIEEMIHKLHLIVLEIHAADFVKDPRKTISRICTFLGLPCPEDFLQACYDKAYKTESKSRNLVTWPKDVRAAIDTVMRNIPFFRRYSFEGD